MTNIDKLVKSYYYPYNEQRVEDIYGQIITEEDKLRRELLLREYNPFINRLRSRFKKLILERNNLAQKNGFDNYFDYISDWDKIPKRELKNFLKEGGLTSRRILARLPERFKDPDWLQGNYNNFNFYGMVEDRKFDIPDEIFNLLISKIKIKKEVLSQIELKKTSTFIFFANNDFEQKRAWIEYDKRKNDISGAIIFAHECGHAIEHIKLMQKGIDPKSKSYYYHELRAIEMEMKFIDLLSHDAKEARIGNFLYTFANTFFEHEIYKNPECDYDIAYAESRNKVCPQMRQTRNPFYLLNTFLVEYPCYSTIYSVIYNSLLNKK